MPHIKQDSPPSSWRCPVLWGRSPGAQPQDDVSILLSPWLPVPSDGGLGRAQLRVPPLWGHVSEPLLGLVWENEELRAAEGTHITTTGGRGAAAVPAGAGAGGGWARPLSGAPVTSGGLCSQAPSRSCTPVNGF